MSVRSTGSRIPVRSTSTQGLEDPIYDDDNPRETGLYSRTEKRARPGAKRESISVQSDTVSSIDLGNNTEVIITPTNRARLSTASTLLESAPISPSVAKGIHWARDSPNRHDAVHVYRKENSMYCEMFSRSETVEVMKQIEDMSSVRVGVDRIKFEAQILLNLELMASIMHSQMAKTVSVYLKSAERWDEDDEIYEALPDSVKHRMNIEPTFLDSPGKYMLDPDMFNRTVMGLLAYRSMVRE